MKPEEVADLRVVQPKPRRLPRGYRPALVASLAIVIVCMGNELTLPINGDVQWILTIAARVLDGGQLYREILEINPPLIIWLHLPVVWLGRVLDVPAATVLRLCTLALAVSSAATVARLLHGTARSPAARKWLFPALLFVLLVIPGGMFGQREQFITILVLPYLALTVRRVEGRSLPRLAAVGSGMAAGVAFCIKPHFLGIWLLLMTFSWRAGRSRQGRLEDLSLVATGALYVLSVLVFTPDFVDKTRVFAGTYMRFTTQTHLGILLSSPAEVWLIAAVVAWVVRRPGTDDGATGPVLALGGAGSFLAVILQGKGWTYHALPTVCFAVLLGLLALADRPAAVRRRADLWLRAAAAGLLLASWVPLGWQIVGRYDRRPGHGPLAVDPELRQLSEAVARERDAHSILVLSADMTSSLPWIDDLGLTRRNSFSYLWVPTAMYHAWWNSNPRVALRSVAEMTEVERVSYDAVVRDLTRNPPDILVVESRVRNERLTGYPGGFDHLRYYRADARFAAEFAHYRQTAKLAGFAVYRRRSEASIPDQRHALQ